MGPDEVRARLNDAGATRVSAADVSVRGVHVDALLPAARLRGAATALREGGFLIEDVTAVDASPEILLVYHFQHPAAGCRAVLRVLVDREEPAVPTIHDIFAGANWHERETHDFFGVVFEGHPDLSPLILPEDAGDLRPLRKAEKALKHLGEAIPEFAEPPEGGSPETERKAPDGGTAGSEAEP